MKLLNLLHEIYMEALAKKLDESYAIVHEDTRLFQELADPDYAYKYHKLNNETWWFNDKYGNKLGCSFSLSTRYFESFFYVKDKNGNEYKVYHVDKDKLEDPTSYQGGSDEHRSDTIAKIFIDEVVEKHLIPQKGTKIIMHPIDEYRKSVFLKVCDLVQEKYPEVVVKQLGKEVYLINK